MFTYTSTGGFGTKTFTVQSGTFPTGLTLNANGTVTGVYTVAGNFSWVVQAIDQLGTIATIPDSAVVTQYMVFASHPGSGSPTVTASILTSVNGSSWNNTTIVNTGSGTSAELIESYNGKLFSIRNGSGRVSSDGGLNWIPLTGITAYDPQTFTYTGTKYISTTIGEPTGKVIRTSTDGVNFFPENLPSVCVPTASISRGTTTILVGASDTAEIQVSHNSGSTWTDINLAGTPDLEGLADSGTMFATCAGHVINGGVYISATGDTWNLRPIPSANNSLSGMAYGKGMFVCMDRAGKSFYSIDNGTTWLTGGVAFGGIDLSFTSAQFNYDNKLIYANGLFIAGGVTGTIWTSPDSLTWTQKLNTGSGLVRSLTRYRSGL